MSEKLAEQNSVSFYIVLYRWNHACLLEKYESEIPVFPELLDSDQYGKQIG